MASSTSKTDKAWQLILEKYPIAETVNAGGIYHITADAIKEFREPRLMTKWDTAKALPVPLKKNNLNVLPVSRSEYAIADFSLYCEFPEDVPIAKPISLPDFETLTVNQITSESNAINALILSGALDDFLGQENTVGTFNGRMGADSFQFSVNRLRHPSARISVNGAQLEIDAGFENDESVVIMEAKNIAYEDFHVRQLYYPYRKYLGIVSKPIRLVFSQYTNMTYRLFEYSFENPYDYSSIVLLRQRAYTFENRRITREDLWAVWNRTRAKTDDNQDYATAPFIQADNFDRIISLFEYLGGMPDGATTEQVVSFMGLTERQASYYPAAGVYLGIFERPRGRVCLTDVGRLVLSKDKRGRLLAFASLMFEHEILRWLFKMTYISGSLPPKSDVIAKMAELNVCNPGTKGSTYDRRASTPIAWVKWLFNLIDD